MQKGRLRRAVDGLITLNLVVAGLALLAMLGHVVLDVILREIHAPFSGTLEIVSFWYMVALVFLAVPVAQAHGHHIRVELFTAAVSPRVQQMLDLLVLAGCVVVLAIFVWVSTEEALRQTSRSAVVEAGTGTIIVWPTRWLVPFSMATTALICLLQGFDLIRGLLGHEMPARNHQESHDV
ncbi:TRAP transporter small permease [Pararhodobacter marinus]|uniref:TRAP transporter small permease n=1 Tax=Pararhodobacter marinus TaxID=2184063 RepID=UPI003518537E